MTATPIRLISPIARVRMMTSPPLEFLTGDGRLRFVNVTLGELQRSSTCRIEVYDPGLAIASTLFDMSFKAGGIEVPSDLLSDPTKATAAGGTIRLAEADTLGIGSGAAPADQGQTVQLILQECARQGVTDQGQIAYILGTAQHESNFAPIPEYSSGEQYEGRTDIGNTQPGDGVKYKGRGYVQITGRTNYQRYSELTGKDLINNPDIALDPNVAVYTLVHGMKNGVFTGVGLSDYISGGSNDFVGARAIVNGTDRADLIAGYAQDWLTKLPGLLNSGNTVTPAAQQATQASSKQAAIKDKADSKPQEVSQKGTEIIVELGYAIDQLIEFHFIHTGTTTQGRMLDSTVIEGQTVRWLMTRRTKNTTYGNITLRQLAEQVAASYGLTLEMEGDGVTYQHLSQSGITDYELLLREARAIGYSVQDSGTTLILKPFRPNFTGFVITQDMLVSIQFSDRASRDRQPTATATAANPATATGDPKVTIDRLTGAVSQTKTEDSTATGLKPNRSTAKNSESGVSVFLTGSPVRNVRGTVLNPTIAGVINSAIPGIGSSGQSSAPINPTDPPAQKDGGTGLPSQPIGAIDLADGSATAEVIKDEARRVKGYESSAVIVATPESLTIAPGAIIGISSNIVPSVFSREWRVETASHTMQGGKFQTQLQFYSPQKAKDAEGSIRLPEAGAQSKLDAPPSSQGWGSPMAIEGNSSCGAVCEYGYARGRLHEGLDFGGYGSGADPDAVFASSSGTVTRANTTIGAFGGYGRCVDIERSDGWLSRYGHLASVLVAEGDTVTQGQKIGVRGGSGSSSDSDYDIHLHFEIRSPDGTAVDPREYLPQPQIPIA